MAKTVGLYLGVNSIGVAVVAGRSILSLNQFDLSATDDSKGDVANEDVRLEALINKALRESGAEEDSIYLSMADRDFIFRSLEMPVMRQTEIESSLVYEVEKYVPFKMTELEWTYASMRVPKDKKMNISFVGIRDSNLLRIRQVLERLGLRAKFIEPSSLSLIRALKTLKRFSKLKDFALLDLTEKESHLTFFQNNLPAFNRYLTIPKKEDLFDAAKFSESVDFSFQYFKREFRSYRIDKFIVATDIENKELTSSLEDGLQAQVETVSSFGITNRNNASIESVKAFGAATSDQYPLVFKTGFKKTEISQEGEIAEIVVEAPPLRVGLMGALLGLALGIALFTSIIMGNEVSVKEVDVKKAKEAVIIPEPLAPLAWGEYQTAVKELEVKIKTLQKAAKSFNNLSEAFKSLSSRRVLPEGLWLENLKINRRGEGYSATMAGYIFRDDDYQERQGLDDFMARLKTEYALQTLFSKVELDSSSRQQKKDFEVTYFSINLK